MHASGIKVSYKYSLIFFFLFEENYIAYIHNVQPLCVFACEDPSKSVHFLGGLKNKVEMLYTCRFMYLNPSSPEHFSRTYFPKGGGVVVTPQDYQYGRSYNPKFTTIV